MHFKTNRTISSLLVADYSKRSRLWAFGSFKSTHKKKHCIRHCVTEFSRFSSNRVNRVKRFFPCPLIKYSWRRHNLPSLLLTRFAWVILPPARLIKLWISLLQKSIENKYGPQEAKTDLYTDFFLFKRADRTNLKSPLLSVSNSSVSSTSSIKIINCNRLRRT